MQIQATGPYCLSRWSMVFSGRPIYIMFVFFSVFYIIIEKFPDNIGLVEQVPETLPEEVLGKMSAPPKSDVPIITPDQLTDADGLVFGFPTRYGMMAAQFKAFLDATGGLWRSQQLAGKPAGLFYSTGSQGGGQETTA